MFINFSMVLPNTPSTLLEHLNELRGRGGGGKSLQKKNRTRDVIKMREMRGEVGKKTPKKRWIISHFYDVTWLIYE